MLWAIVPFGACGILALMAPSLSEPPEISIALPAPDV